MNKVTMMKSFATNYCREHPTSINSVGSNTAEERAVSCIVA